MIDITQFNKPSIEFKGEIRFSHPAQQLWRYISNLDIIDRIIGAPKPTYTLRNSADQKTRPWGKASMMGIILEYEELPFEWVPLSHFSLERIHHQGPFQYTYAEVRILRNETNGCYAELISRGIPRYPFFSKFVLKMVHQKYLQGFQQVDAKIPRHGELPFEAFLQFNAQVSETAQALNQQWRYLMPESLVPEKFAEFLYAAPEPYVEKIRPYEVAAYYGLSKEDSLNFCLLATKAGFLHLSWDILCPSCRGSNQQSEALHGLISDSHCPACNINYSAGFDQNVEVRFSPDPKVRKIESGLRCPFNPAFNPHVWSQINLDPHETRKIAMWFEPGQYRIQSLSIQGSVTLEITNQPGLPQELKLEISESFPERPLLRLGQNLEIHFHNVRDAPQTIKIERLHYREHAVIAASLTSLQDFRDLFSSEVLRPGVQLGISHVIVLFTDLKGSTQLYENQGDASAFALVQEHFDILIKTIRRHQGGIVKTIGDAVMAVFMSAENCLRCCLEALQAFDKRNLDHPEEQHVIIKLGFHGGPCITLNLNDKLDYFGSTINIAARTEGQCKGSDVVLTESVMKSIDLNHILKDYPYEAEAFITSLKGISEKQTLVRIFKK